MSSDVASAVWTRIGLPFQLKLEAKNGTSYKFDGFREADVESLKKYVVKGYGVAWKEEAVSHRGWNWGVVEVEGPTLKFSVDEQPSFELPLNEATSANVTKTEVSVSFNPSGEAAEDSDALAEIKFFVPNTRGDEVPETVQDHVTGAEGEDDEIPEFNEELLVTPAEALANKIMDKIEVLPANAQPIVVFERTSMSTPRGQVDLQLHPNFFFLAGKNFRIDYNHIVRIFLLPQTRDDLSSFIVSVDPPIRQGSTSYPLIVFSIPNKEVEVSLNQDGIPEKSNLHALGANVAGPLDEVIAKVLGTLADKKVTRTSAHGFKSVREEPCVPCKYKAADGHVYPLEQSFVVIVPKTPIHVPFSDIAFVSFELISQLVTLELHLKSGTVHSLMVIPAAHHLALYNFCKAKNLKVEGDQPITESEASRSKRSSAIASRAATRQQIRSASGQANDDDDDDDGDFQAGEEEEDDEDEEFGEGGDDDGDDEEADNENESDGEAGDKEDAPTKKNKKRAAPTQGSDDEDTDSAPVKKPKTEADE